MESDHGWRGELTRAFREHWRYFLLAAGLFIAGMVIGALLVERIDLFAMIGIGEFEEVLPEQITTALILINNTLVMLVTLLGVFTLGLLTTVVIVFNGIVVGYVVTPIARDVGVDFVLVGLLPHGVLELPAFFMTAAVAFRLLHLFILRVLDRRDRLLDEGGLYRIGLYLATAWVLLAIAAIIEVHVTLWLLETLYPDISADPPTG